MIQEVDILGKTPINGNFNTIYRNKQKKEYFQSISKKLWPIEFLLLIKREVKSINAVYIVLHPAQPCPKRYLQRFSVSCVVQLFSYEPVNPYKNHMKNYYFSHFIDKETET